jgi:L-ascorbate metabolism protein UlaG (beta-lactamase superfamily)
MLRRDLMNLFGRLIPAGTGVSLLAPRAARAAKVTAPESAGEVSVTWIAHGTVLYRSVEGRNLLVDPWLATNPGAPGTYRRSPKENFERVDMMLYTHGHADHFMQPDAEAVISAFDPLVIAPWEMGYVIKSLIPTAKTQHHTLGNKGSWVDFDGIKVAMVAASHSSGAHFVGFEGITNYVGGEVGFIIEFENGLRVYHAGDTALMADMKVVIGDFYKPDVAVLPIGGIYTMGPAEAAYACRLIRPRVAIPIHYRTFPSLVQNADEFLASVKDDAPETTAIVLEPGESSVL